MRSSLRRHQFTKKPRPARPQQMNDTATSQGMLMCSHCQQRFAEPELVKHFSECCIVPGHISPRLADFYCEQCEVGLATLDSLERHLPCLREEARLHAVEPLRCANRCRFCGYCNSHKGRPLHLHVHRFHHDVICAKCKKTFRGQYRLTIHQRKKECCTLMKEVEAFSARSEDVIDGDNPSDNFSDRSANTPSSIISSNQRPLTNNYLPEGDDAGEGDSRGSTVETESEPHLLKNLVRTPIGGISGLEQRNEYHSCKICGMVSKSSSSVQRHARLQHGLDRAEARQQTTHVYMIEPEVIASRSVLSRFNASESCRAFDESSVFHSTTATQTEESSSFPCHEDAEKEYKVTKSTLVNMMTMCNKLLTW